MECDEWTPVEGNTSLNPNHEQVLLQYHIKKSVRTIHKHGLLQAKINDVLSNL